LSEYDFEIQHRAGIKMSHVDALSRAPTDEPGDTEAEVLDGHLEVLITLSEEGQVIAMQHTDVKLRSIMKVLCSNETFRSKVDSDLIKDYYLSNGMLYKEVTINWTKRKLWVIPDSMRKSIVVRFHDLNGHFALDRTVDKIQEHYYFPRMRRYVRMHIK
jgi:hypothetical protein